METNPKTEEEIKEEARKRFGVLPAGEYDFDVLEAEDTRSKKGNDMIHVILGIYDGDRIKKRQDDYLLEAMEAKLRHFCDSVGLLSRYESGQLVALDCVGRSGRVKLKVKPAVEPFPEKNEVADYCCRKAKPIGHAQEPTPPPPDEDLPF